MSERTQLSRQDWIEAARKVLVTSGIDDVKVDRLARKMKVTRGSFYWHFKDRKDLLDALLARWERQNLDDIAAVRERVAADASEAIQEVVRIWLTEDPAYPTFDMAIRFWARKAPAVAKLVRRIDQAWLSLLTDILVRSDEDPLDAEARARVFYFHQIGYYALAIDESVEDRLRLSPHYAKVLLGTGVPFDAGKLAEQVRATMKPTRRRRANTVTR
jgi:AcrR family transcriptional regulator